MLILEKARTTEGLVVLGSGVISHIYKVNGNISIYDVKIIILIVVTMIKNIVILLQICFSGVCPTSTGSQSQPSFASTLFVVSCCLVLLRYLSIESSVSK